MKRRVVVSVACSMMLVAPTLAMAWAITYSDEGHAYNGCMSAAAGAAADLTRKKVYGNAVFTNPVCKRTPNLSYVYFSAFVTWVGDGEYGINQLAGHGYEYQHRAPTAASCANRPNLSNNITLAAPEMTCVAGCEYSLQTGPNSSAAPTGGVCHRPPLEPDKNNECCTL